MSKTKIFLEAAVVIIVVLALVMPGSASITNINEIKKGQNVQKEGYTSQMNNLGGNILVSFDNPEENDIHPRICQGPGGIIVIVYEKIQSIFSKVIPVVWSDDGGDTWTTQFIFDSIEFTDGSGILQYPDILYNPSNDVYFLGMIDPLADMYNNEMAFIPGDIVNAEEASWYGISGSTSENYNYHAAACTENFFLSMTTEDTTGLEQIFGLGYWTYPDFEHPEVMGGYYYDGQSVHVSAPSSKLEMSTGSNRVFVVAETETDTGPKISIKSTVTDETLLTNGEQQNGMDKYADIEQWPGEYIADDATNPDVSASGSKVCVVYVKDEDVKCSYSSDDGQTFGVSTVADNAGFPAVFVSGNSVICAYVKNGNLYQVKSDDGGESWGEPTQVNDADGSVVSEESSVDVDASGVTWTDNRNGNYDIYFAAVGNAPSKPNRPDGPSSGKPRRSYAYSTSSTDPNGDDISYGWDWDGDDIVDEWTQFYSSGETVSISHSWSSDFSGDIKVKAKDTNDEESVWSDPLPISIPKYKISNLYQILERLIDIYPNLILILNYLNLV